MLEVKQEAVQNHGLSIALSEGQGIPDYINAPSEQYDGIVYIIHTTLAEGQYTDPV